MVYLHRQTFVFILTLVQDCSEAFHDNCKTVGARSLVDDVGETLVVPSNCKDMEESAFVMQISSQCLLQRKLNLGTQFRKNRFGPTGILKEQAGPHTPVETTSAMGVNDAAVATPVPTPAPPPGADDDVEFVAQSLTLALTSHSLEAIKAAQRPEVLTCDEVCLWDPKPDTSTRRGISLTIQSNATSVFNLEDDPPSSDSEEIPSTRREAYFRPVSVTMYCVMWLTIQTLVVHTGLAIARNVDELSGKTEPSTTTLTLSIASRGTHLAPVMCLLFVANRLRVLAVTNGLGEPSYFVKVCMIAATLGMAGQLCVVVFIGRFAASKDSMQRLADAASGEIGSGGYKTHVRLDEDLFAESKNTQRLTYISQLVSMVCLYGGIVGVAAFGSLYQSKEGQRPLHLSAAVWSSAFMSLLYFLAEFGLWAAATQEDGVSIPKRAVKDGQPSVVPERRGGCCVPMSGSSDDEKDSENSMTGAELTTLDRVLAAFTVVTSAVEKAPMLAVLFLAARIRHLQVNPPDGTPPRSVEIAFSATAVALAFEILVSAYIGFIGKEDVSYYRIKLYRATRLAHILQHSSAAAAYISMGVVFVSLRQQWASGGSLPLSPTMLGVMSLCSLYFTVHVLLWLGSIRRDIFDKASPVLQNTLLAARVSLTFCPILCVLFIGCRMRALQITQQQGAPQWWEQDCIHLCVCAVFVQFACCLTLPIFSGAAASVDSEGNAIYDLRPLIGAYAVTMVKYVALLSLHGGVIGICVAVFTMTPETALPIKPEANSMFKAVIRAGICTLVALVIATFLSSAKVIGLAVKLGIESVDEMLLGIQITVGKAAISMCRGFVNVENLIAHNPGDQDFASPHLLKVGKMVVKINMGKLVKSFGKHFEIEEVILDCVELNFEKGTYDRPSNVKSVLNFLDGSATDNATATTSKPSAEVTEACEDLDASHQTQPKAAEEESSIQVELKHVRIAGIGVQVVLTAVGTVASVQVGDLDIPDFTKRMSSGGGVSTIVMVVMKTLLKTVMSNAAIFATLTKHAVRAVGGGAMRVMAKTCCSPAAPKKARPLAACRPIRASGRDSGRA